MFVHKTACIVSVILASCFLAACGEDEKELPFPDPGPAAISATTQVIYLQFTSEFTIALGRFGLRAAEAALKRNIRTHLQQNLQGYDFSVLIAPGELALASGTQTATVAVRGNYPADLHIFSNENSSLDKDIGNKIRNEVVGGYNDEYAAMFTPEAGHGGIFVGEHFFFSKAIGSKLDPQFKIPFSSRFDNIFGPFAPELGGSPIEAYPGSRDDAAVYVAVDTLAALIAATSTQLTGFLVGLPAGVPEDVFINTGDNGCYLDLGDYRSFEARAKLLGQSETFCPANAQYLQQILPLASTAH